MAKPDKTKILLILTAEGMPVDFLWDISVNVSVEWNQDIETSQTVISTWDDWLDRADIEFSEHDSIGMPRMRDKTLQGSPESVGAFYHEFTHAYLSVEDLDESRHPFWRAARLYYERAPLEDGGSVGDTHRAVTEAAAMYVENRTAAAWRAIISTVFLRTTYSALIRKRDPLSIYRNIKFAIDEYLKTPSTFEDECKQTEFGYVEKGGKQVKIAKDINISLKTFCDDNLLENKIDPAFGRNWFAKDYFWIENALNKFIAEITARNGIQRRRSVQFASTNVHNRSHRNGRRPGPSGRLA